MKYPALFPAVFLAIAALAPAIFETQQEVDQPVQIVAIRSDETSNGAVTSRKAGLDGLCLASQQWLANNDTLQRSSSPPRRIARTPHKLKVQQNC